MTGRLARAVVASGTALTLAGTIHSWFNLRQLRVLPRMSTASGSATKATRVSVLVPARDEAARVGHCLASIRGQVGVAHLEIVVLDDRSSDGTDQVVRRHLDDERVTLLVAEGEPPEGWLGKAWACHQLARAASGDVLVFVDADVTLEVDAVARVVELLSTGEVDAVSPYPRQVALTMAERVVQPLLQWSWATMLPLGVAERNDNPALVAANGQLLAITGEAYDECGGHEAVRDRVLDDIALFQRLKAVGRRAVLADGTDVAECRMYDDWPSLRDGYSKSLWAATGSPKTALALSAALTATYVVPPLAAITRGSRVGVLGYTAAVAGRALVAKRTDGRVWPDALMHPASVLAFNYLSARSWVGRRRRTLTWKSRPLP